MMEKHKNLKRWLAGGAMVVVCVAFALWFYFQETSRQSAVLKTEESETQKDGDQPEKAGDIYVHITGAVQRPGVIKLPAGSRLTDAIEALGGLTGEADTDSVNLAAILEDEDKIHIYTEDEASQPGPAGENPGEAGRVNINTADLETLKTLPGIGDAIGKNILEYREKNGPFKAPEDLKEVDRIGDKLYERLKDQITL